MNSQKRWMCVLCGFIYDEAVGLPEEGIAAGTAWSDIPNDFECPDCGFGKADFEMVELSAPALASEHGPIIIIGGGLAAFSIAESIRAASANTKITIITETDGSQYYKPALSGAYSASKAPRDLLSGTAVEFSKKHSITVASGTRVVSIDRKRKSVETSDGTSFSYDKLILATGASARQLSCQGDGLHRVLHLNNMADYQRMRTAMDDAHDVAVIGGGLVGCELAEDLAFGGKHVTLFEMQKSPVASVFPTEVGNKLISALADLNITWRGGVIVQGISEVETGLCLTEDNGSKHRFDCVIAAVGVVPNTELAASSGLLITRFGTVCVDDDWRTEDIDIFALGDCASKPEKYQPFVETIIRASAAITAQLCSTSPASKDDFCSVVLKTRSFPVYKIEQGERSPIVAADAAEDSNSYFLRDPRGFPEALVILDQAKNLTGAKRRLKQEQDASMQRFDQVV